MPEYRKPNCISIGTISELLTISTGLTAIANRYGITGNVVEGIKEVTDCLRALIDRIRNPHKYESGEEQTDELKHFNYDSKD